MTTRTLAVVTAGLRDPSSTSLLADRLTDATTAELHEHGTQAEVVRIDLRTHAQALTNALLAGFAAEELQAALDAVAGADGVIAVSPIFSGSYSGLFKTFFDLLGEDAVVGVPVLLGATAGTPRHSLAVDHALRPLFAYLRALVVPTGVFAATDDFGAPGRAAGTDDDGAPPLASRIERAGGELAALMASRPARERRDEFADVTSFEDLFGGS